MTGPPTWMELSHSAFSFQMVGKLPGTFQRHVAFFETLKPLHVRHTRPANFAYSPEVYLPQQFNTTESAM